jgi:subtilisin family serine protease
MRKLILIALLSISYIGFAQTEGEVTTSKITDSLTTDSIDKLLKPDTTFIWYQADYEEDGYAGISLNQAYDFAKEKNLKSKEIIVAIIDSGIDTSHVDLKDNLWVNPREIPYNGIDDDGNGYIDDIHGWNFLGNQNGYCIEGETLELTRLYRKYKKKYKDKTKKDIKPEDKEEYEEWLGIKSRFYIKRLIYKGMYKSIKDALKYYDKCEKMLANYFDDPNFTREQVESLEPRSESLADAKEFYLRWDNRQELEDMLETYDSYANKKYNVLYNPRKKVGDDPLDINDSIYGNNILYVGKSSSHGTGVSGIVGAVRDNNVGIDGIAPNVKLMIIRVVPGGDERDKDVALGIRYAVNNGARIINCSFGKDFSPQKEFVDEAVRYARDHNVLIIHAAGNDSRNIDKGHNYPTKKLDNPEEVATNWIEVGASGKHPDDSLIAEFSNYGMLVDIFAPGVDIYSTALKSKYRSSSGTSDASPVVCGVAALVLSYYPDLTAEELKSIILESGTYYGDLKVLKPEEYKKRKKKKFKKLCSNPRVVNANSALRMAYERQNSGN